MPGLAEIYLQGNPALCGTLPAWGGTEVVRVQGGGHTEIYLQGNPGAY